MQVPRNDATANGVATVTVAAAAAAADANDI